MVPQVFASFFVGSMGASAALVGLLFVAVSIKPERITARGAPPEPQAVAASAFTALANAFFISLGGAVPGFNIGSVALWASLISLAETLNLGRKLWRGRPGLLHTMRRLALVMLIPSDDRRRLAVQVRQHEATLAGQLGPPQRHSGRHLSGGRWLVTAGKAL